MVAGPELARRASSPTRRVRSRSPLGTRVAHERWGEGLVQRYEADKVVVLFDEVGYKTLDAELVAERGLVTPID